MLNIVTEAVCFIGYHVCDRLLIEATRLLASIQSYAVSQVHAAARAKQVNSNDAVSYDSGFQLPGNKEAIRVVFVDGRRESISFLGAELKYNPI